MYLRLSSNLTLHYKIIITQIVNNISKTSKIHTPSSAITSTQISSGAQSILDLRCRRLRTI